MIVQLTPHSKYPRRMTWKEELRKSIYDQNKQLYQSQRMKRSSILKKVPKYKTPTIQKHKQRLDDNMKDDSYHGYYSFFIPLSMQAKFEDNELTLAFPFLRRNNDSRTNLATYELILQQIAEEMAKSKEKSQVDCGWFACLKKYMAGIDSIKAIELYLQLKKKGKSGNLSRTLWQRYGGGCTSEIFIEKLQCSATLLRKRKAEILRSFSIDSQQNITQVTMAKTMKQLFCSICLIYDCSQHSWDSVIKQKDFHYVAPKSIISERQRLQDAMELCLAYHKIAKATLAAQEPVDQQKSCSSCCYKLLKGESWQMLQKQLAKVVQPMVKGIVRLGIEMFSYSPCRISTLLLDRDLTRYNITCSDIFLSLIEDYNLIERLEQKLKISEMDKLLFETKGTEEEYPTQHRTQTKKSRARQKQNNSNCPISSCVHYFIAEQPIDTNCQNCSCRIRNFCVPSCLCRNDCPIRKKGCSCKKEDCRTTSCPCMRNDEECDPKLCKNCFCKSSGCRNHQIMRCSFKKVKAGVSAIKAAGLGLFAGEEIMKGELVMIYGGEIIDYSIEALRETLRADEAFYNFGSPQGTIDGRFMGNLSRFINHADEEQENLCSKTILTEGRYKIAFYAKKDIEENQQLYFDYDGDGELYKNYRSKYPFIRKEKKKK